MKAFIIFTLLILFLFFSCANSSTNATAESVTDIAQIHKANSKITLDGSGDDPAWQSTEWRMIDQVWEGVIPDEEDFTGKYKLLWSVDRLYVLAVIHDDKVIDIEPDGLVNYWDDDCLELFIDENNSDGDHQYNHSAFAYHIATNLRVTDLGRDGNPMYLDHHLQSAKSIDDNNNTTWEIGMRIYQEEDIMSANYRQLSAGETIGFSIAYCDNDNSSQRESFIGSNPIKGKNKNMGWIDAGVFGNWVLVE